MLGQRNDRWGLTVPCISTPLVDAVRVNRTHRLLTVAVAGNGLVLYRLGPGVTWRFLPRGLWTRSVASGGDEHIRLG